MSSHLLNAASIPFSSLDDRTTVGGGGGSKERGRKMTAMIMSLTSMGDTSSTLALGITSGPAIWTPGSRWIVEGRRGLSLLPYRNSPGMHISFLLKSDGVENIIRKYSVLVRHQKFCPEWKQIIVTLTNVERVKI